MWSGSNYRTPIAEKLQALLTESISQEPYQSILAKDVVARLQAFSVSGKMVRGSLVMAVAKHLGGDTASAVIAAASLELFGSALLIHDDIADRDRTRRGQATIYGQYITEAGTTLSEAEATHHGVSMGIVVGDVSFFLVFKWLTQLNDPELSRQLSSILSEKAIVTGYSELEDIRGSQLADAPITETAVTAMYQGKTAEYTFVLPLLWGAALGGRLEELREPLTKLGLALGTLYQLRDDWLGIFGETAQTGKPVGADIREGKVTIWVWAAYEQADAQTRKKIKDILTKHTTDKVEISWLQNQIKLPAVLKAVQTYEVAWQASAQHEIAQLHNYPELQRELTDLLSFIGAREK